MMDYDPSASPGPLQLLLLTVFLFIVCKAVTVDVCPGPRAARPPSGGLEPPIVGIGARPGRHHCSKCCPLGVRP